jgi:preprotein translocase subunit SecA
MFMDMRQRIEALTIEQLYRIQIVEEKPPEDIEKPSKSTRMVLSHGAAKEPAVEQPMRKSGPEIGRNDPCPCGSGKKYKKCCGRTDAGASA